MEIKSLRQTIGFSTLLKDIRFWIVFFFLIRLIGITNPPLEVAHNWRQTTVTMVARNFLEIDNNILYPRIDFAGEKTGITGMEFPVLNYLIYLVSELFGYQHWYGRLINLMISSMGIWWFFKLIRNYFTKEIAFNASLILLVSIWFQFSRKIMPDTFSMSLIIGGIYYASNYFNNEIKSKKIFHLFFSIFLLLVGVLSKLPSGYLFVVFLFFIIDKDIVIQRKIIFLVILSLVMIPVIFWYFYWVPMLVEKYQFWHFFMGKSISLAIQELQNNIGDAFKRFYDTALKFIGFGVFVFGIIMAIRQKEKRILYLFLITFLGFIVIILKAGFHFTHHSYYIIPFVPIMALIAGYGLSLIKNKKIAIFLLIAICLEGIGNQLQDFRIKKEDKAILNLEKELDQFSSKNELVLINSGECPTTMYFTHRKGWIATDEKIANENYINELVKKGLKYIIILKNDDHNEIKLTNRKILFQNGHHTIYRAKKD
jgi:hypothetical protein